MREMFKRVVLVVAVVGFVLSMGFAFGLFAQEVPVESKECFLIVCDTKPEHMLVLDSNGTWVSGVRSVNLRVDFSTAPTVSCTIWHGPIKPSNPISAVWKVVQIKSVSVDEFDKTVDALQDNPNFLAVSMAKK